MSKYISAKHILCPSYRRTRMSLRVKRFDREYGTDQYPAKVDCLFWTYYTNLQVPSRQPFRGRLQGRSRQPWALFLTLSSFALLNSFSPIFHNSHTDYTPEKTVFVCNRCIPELPHNYSAYLSWNEHSIPFLVFFPVGPRISAGSADPRIIFIVISVRSAFPYARMSAAFQEYTASKATSNCVISPTNTKPSCVSPFN